ncbi:MAG: hypothetical protein ACT4P4_20210 [Betaproteobacteria bacterium]
MDLPRDENPETHSRAAQSPSLMLLDLGLPNCEGIQALVLPDETCLAWERAPPAPLAVTMTPRQLDVRGEELLLGAQHIDVDPYVAGRAAL